MVIVNAGGEQYYISKKNKRNWDNIKDGKLKKLGEDRVYIVDGRERSGKSTFAAQQIGYIDPTFIKDTSRLTYSVDETLKAIRETDSSDKITKCILWDEAFRGLSSKSAISKVNKRLVQALMEMGEKNLVLFIVSPSFFLLEMYASVLRSNTLFHIVKDKRTGKRFYRAFGYDEKAILYNMGIKRGWSYNINIPLENKDWFFDKWPGGERFRQMYLAKKRKSIRSFDDEDKSEKYTLEDKKYFIMEFIKNWHEKGLKIQQKQIAEGFGVHPQTIATYKAQIMSKNT